MEGDYDSSTPLNSVATKHEDPPNLNHLLSTIASQITDATNKMSLDFQQVTSDNRIFKQDILDANDVFKQEVRDQIFARYFVSNNNCSTHHRVHL
jgi:hypothetical protein